MIKVLFITKYIPYRADSGITVRINNLLKCMNGICRLSCVFICEDKTAADTALEKCGLERTNHIVIEKTHTSPMFRYLKHWMGILRPFKEVKSGLREVIENEKPDLIWLEFGYIGHLIPFLKQFNLPVYYGSHNYQFHLDLLIWQNMSGIVRKTIQLPMLFFKMLHERYFFPKADKIFCISSGDIEKYKTFIPRDRLELLPYYFDEEKIKDEISFEPGCHYICMIGGLNSYQNYSAAVFMLEELWPKISLELPSLHLYIVGRLPSENTPEYTMLKILVQDCKNVILTGRVESVIPYVLGASANIVPILIGSGVRTKIIESAACRTPVVSTPIGAEGLPFVDGESICIADSSEKLVEKIIDIVSSPEIGNRIGNSAFKKFRVCLSLEAGRETLAGILKK
ncbi:MAG: glycosyltransferase family 4 protein [Desulfobacula sp.]|uniref:glycosyltransferase family 4 protein n=1 Tax=Desulfobacula sp. TaxID=2593537 RepID=UPI0025B918A1|nr:glycosyltransferase family 4 protein [Desulfobacula sp.]MCD4722093.1 glycosyltransferase family 4 protein [Desulfobacula sp.]